MDRPDDAWISAADLTAMPPVLPETTPGVRRMIRESSYVRWLTGGGAWEWGVMLTLTVAPNRMPDGVEGFATKRSAMAKVSRFVRRHKFLRKRPLMVAAELHAYKAGVRDRWHLHMLVGGTNYAERFDREMVEAVAADWRQLWGISQTSWRPDLAGEVAVRYAVKYCRKGGASVFVRLPRGDYGTSLRV